MLTEVHNYVLLLFSGGFRGVSLVPRNLPFIGLSARVARLVRVHKRSQNILGQRNPPVQNPRSATDVALPRRVLPQSYPRGAVMWHGATGQ